MIKVMAKRYLWRDPKHRISLMGTKSSVSSTRTFVSVKTWLQLTKSIREVDMNLEVSSEQITSQI